jgi:hypothetical protein
MSPRSYSSKQRVHHRLRRDLIPPPFRFMHEITFPALILPLDAPGLEEVLCKVEVGRVVGHPVKTEYGELELGMAGVAV